MATGSVPFSGQSPADVMVAILAQHPKPPSRLNTSVPAEMDRIILKALEKDPKLRYESAAALKTDLMGIRQGNDSGYFTMSTAPPRRQAGYRYVWAAVLALLVGLAGMFFFYRARPATIAGSHWIQLTDLPAAVQPALSVDGHILTFLSGSSAFFGPAEVWVKLLPDGTPKQLTHDGAPKMSPVFSPDASRIAYTIVDSNFRWDTWVVDALGGTPQRWLSNASGLVWIDARHLLFSEMRERIHMLSVTATENRIEQRNVYVPPHDRGMAHRSYLSPDRRWVLLVEMDNGGWLPCRVVPFDGTSRGSAVGPSNAACIGAAWSPDGRWMYLNARSGSAYHLWRQRFPSGVAEQMTFGPTEETGVWVDPDGRSILTSAGVTNSQVWIHDGNEERQLQVTGSATISDGSHRPAHVHSPVGGALYFLRERRVGMSAGNELWTAGLKSGATEPVITGVEVTGYDVAPDGKRIAYVSPDNNGRSRLWISRIDHQTPPLQIAGYEADEPCFAHNGTLFFRGVEKGFNFVYRLDEKSQAQKVVEEPITVLHSCSADGRWVAVTMKASKEDAPLVHAAWDIQTQRSIALCRICWPVWSGDGRYLFVTLRHESGHAHDYTTYAFELRNGAAVPDLPVEGVTPENVSNLRVAAVIEHTLPSFIPGPSLSTYPVIRENAQRNIYRIPVL